MCGDSHEARSKEAQRAAQLLRAYLKWLALASGKRWDLDNDIEVEEIIDTIVAAAKAEIALNR